RGQLTRHVARLTADVVPQDAVYRREAHLLQSAEVDRSLNRPPAFILRRHSTERLVLDEPLHALRLGDRVDLAGEPQSPVELETELMLRPSTIMLDRFEGPLVVIEVVLHDEADVVDDTTIHLDFL